MAFPGSAAWAVQEWRDGPQRCSSASPTAPKTFCPIAISCEDGNFHIVSVDLIASVSTREDAT